MSAPVVKFVGYPDGPKTFIKELGEEVPTFIEEPGGNFPALNWHVPLVKRGPYRATDLANYSPENDYRLDAEGYVLCYGITKAGSRCSKKALNRYPRCDQHGGRLHPLDKLEKQIADDAQAQSLSRYQQFLAKQITVDDLDDEELAMCGFRSEKNGNIYRPKNVPRELTNAFQKAIFERANEEMRSLVVDAARTIGEIMRNKTNEPDIRLKAATSVLERNLGKASQNVIVSQDKPFEHIFSDIEVGSREESRRNRGIVIDGTTGEITGEYQSPNDNSDPFGIGPAIIGEIESVPEERRDDNGENRIGDDTSESPIGGVRDALFVRNEAVLAQFVERKPFEYDLEDKSEDIKKATRKRYASRALGIDLDGPNVPFLVEIKRTKQGTFIRYVDPETKSIAAPSNSAEKKRKAYTLNDF